MIVVRRIEICLNKFNAYIAEVNTNMTERYVYCIGFSGDTCNVSGVCQGMDCNGAGCSFVNDHYKCDCPANTTGSLKHINFTSSLSPSSIKDNFLPTPQNVLEVGTLNVIAVVFPLKSNISTNSCYSLS